MKHRTKLTWCDLVTSSGSVPSCTVTSSKKSALVDKDKLSSLDHRQVETKTISPNRHKCSRSEQVDEGENVLSSAKTAERDHHSQQYLQAKPTMQRTSDSIFDGDCPPTLEATPENTKPISPATSLPLSLSSSSSSLAAAVLQTENAKINSNDRTIIGSITQQSFCNNFNDNIINNHNININSKRKDSVNHADETRTSGAANNGGRNCCCFHNCFIVKCNKQAQARDNNRMIDMNSSKSHKPHHHHHRHNRNQYRVTMDDFDLLKVLGTGAYGKVFLVRKLTGHDKGKLYAMKVLRKEIVAQKTKTLDHTRTERKVLEVIRNEPFLVTMHYAFQTKTKLHLILDYVNGGELFTHLYQRDHFKENDVKIYVGELILALEKLHKVSILDISLQSLEIFLKSTLTEFFTLFLLLKNVPRQHASSFSVLEGLSYVANLRSILHSNATQLCLTLQLFFRKYKDLFTSPRSLSLVHTVHLAFYFTPSSPPPAAAELLQRPI